MIYFFDKNTGFNLIERYKTSAIYMKKLIDNATKKRMYILETSVFFFTRKFPFLHKNKLLRFEPSKYTNG